MFVNTAAICVGHLVHRIASYLYYGGSCKGRHAPITARPKYYQRQCTIQQIFYFLPLAAQLAPVIVVSLSCLLYNSFLEQGGDLKGAVSRDVFNFFFI